MAAIELIKPGTHYDKLQEIILEVLVNGLIELDILKGDKKQLIEQKAFHKFYMHSSGHWLGLDVHDVGHYKIEGEWRPLVPGMVLTVEPGLYFTPHTEGLDKRWWGIAVRIEDDILVTEKGHEVLSKAAPKTVSEIENIMKK
jgi:Xaa-Pro aminopeptidase